jgi:hypothetical protein
MKYIKLFEEFGNAPQEEISGNSVNNNFKEVQVILDKYFQDYIHEIYRNVKIKMDNNIITVKMNPGIYTILDSILKGEDTPYTMVNSDMGEDSEKFEVTFIFNDNNKEIPFTIKISDEEYDYMLFDN